MNWQPTPELRWVETKKTYQVDTSGFEHERKVTTLTLQQKWIEDSKWGALDDEEWRDVPVVKEGK